ncbi:MAG: hypothetical protein GOV15_02250, partial [Candidatus Diapherotrites archaeon]|nr:hypothetical protein [Candidatus Diapherotrites archaeon]
TGLHIAGFYLDHMFVGLALVLFFNLENRTLIYGLLAFIPFLLHTLSSTIALLHIHEHMRVTGWRKLFMATSTIIGALIGSVLFQSVSLYAYFASFAFVVGLLLYIIVRDTLPKGKRGNPSLFAIGMVLVAATIYLSRLF